MQVKDLKEAEHHMWQAEVETTNRLCTYDSKVEYLRRSILAQRNLLEVSYAVWVSSFTVGVCLLCMKHIIEGVKELS